MSVGLLGVKYTDGEIDRLGLLEEGLCSMQLSSCLQQRQWSF